MQLSFELNLEYLRTYGNKPPPNQSPEIKNSTSCGRSRFVVAQNRVGAEHLRGAQGFTGAQDRVGAEHLSGAQGFTSAQDSTSAQDFVRLQKNPIEQLAIHRF